MKIFLAVLLSVCVFVMTAPAVFADEKLSERSAKIVFEQKDLIASEKAEPRAEIITADVTLNAYEWSGWVYSENRKTNRVLNMWFTSPTCRKVDIEVYFNGVLFDSKAIAEGEQAYFSTPWDVGLVEVRINNNSNSRANIHFVINDMWV